MGKKKKKKLGSGDRKSPTPHPQRDVPAILKSDLPLRYQTLIAILILVGGICTIYPELVFQNKVFHAGDVEAAASFATPIKNEMREGDVYPLWNPYLFSGMPSYGSLSYNPHVYPVSVLTAALKKYLGFPNSTWLLFHILMLGVGVWLILVDRGVHHLVAAGAGILMMWMPNHVAVGVHGHGSQASAVGYIPFVLFFWDRLWRGKGVVLNASVLVILLGFQLLRAHLQISYYTFALLALHLIFFGILRIRDAFRREGVKARPIFRFLRKPKQSSGGPPWRRAVFEVLGVAVVLAIVVAGALLVSAVLFLPVQDYAKHSIRGASEGGGLDYDYATSWSLHPSEVLTFIIPFSHGFGKNLYYGHMPFTDYPNYLGVVIAVFAVIAAFIVKTRFARFLLFVIVVSTLVAFGKHLPILYNPLFSFVPYFNKFRVPVMVLIVQQFAFVLLFGLGLSAVVRSDLVAGRRKAVVGVVAALGALLVVAATYNYWTDGFAQTIAGKIRSVRSAHEQLEVARMAAGFLFKDLIKFSLLLVVTSTLILLFFVRRLPALAFAILVVLVGLVDIFMVDRHIIHPERLFRARQLAVIKEKQARDQFLRTDGVIDFLREQEGFYRIFPMHHPSAALFGEFRSNRYMNFGISSIGGYHPAKLAIYEEFLGALRTALQRGNLQMVNMLNVRYVVSANAIPENPVLKELWRGTDYKGERRFIYENRMALPRVFFVDKFEMTPGRQALDRLVTDPGLDVSEVVLLDAAPAIEPVSDEGAAATISSHSFNEIRIDANLPSPAILVLSEIFYPRWQVSIDGEPAGILRANHVLRAVALPSGNHEVVFRYDGSLLKKSVAISVATFVVALLVLIGALIVDYRGRMKWKHSS